MPKGTVQATLDSHDETPKNHILDCKWDGFTPTWLIYDHDTSDIRKFEPRPGDQLEIVLSEEKTCVGDFRKETYEPCPYVLTVSRTTQCRWCSKTLIENQDCIFEPRCYGDNCTIDTGMGSTDICREQHAVYLAFYGPWLKVGLTLGPRLQTRLIEQGADAYSLIRMCPNRKAARDFEKKISRKYKIREMVHPSRVLALMANPLDKDDIHDEYIHQKARFKKELDINIGNIQFLEKYPFQTLRSKPRKRPTGGRHSGKIVAIKGKFLIYEHNGLNALRMNDVAGRFANI